MQALARSSNESCESDYFTHALLSKSDAWACVHVDADVHELFYSCSFGQIRCMGMYMPASMCLQCAYNAHVFDAHITKKCEPPNTFASCPTTLEQAILGACADFGMLCDPWNHLYFASRRC